MVKNGSLATSRFFKLISRKNLSVRKILKFPHWAGLQSLILENVNLLNNSVCLNFRYVAFKTKVVKLAKIRIFKYRQRKLFSLEFQAF